MQGGCGPLFERGGSIERPTEPRKASLWCRVVYWIHTTTKESLRGRTLALVLVQCTTMPTESHRGWEVTDVVLRRREIMRTAEIRRDLNVRDDTRRHARLINLSRSDGSSVLGSTLRQTQRDQLGLFWLMLHPPRRGREMCRTRTPPSRGTHSTARVSASFGPLSIRSSWTGGR